LGSLETAVILAIFKAKILLGDVGGSTQTLVTITRAQTEILKWKFFVAKNVY
jgi:hypothetical protein